jgi:putative transposase
MSLDPDLYRRKSIRLRARDYSTPGFYFVTLCTEERYLLFGDIVDGVMHLNDLGRAVEKCWRDIPRHYPHAAMDEFVVMPNHVHGIIQIVTRDWVHVEPPLRAIGLPIVPRCSSLHVPHAANRVSRTNPNWPRGTSRTIGSMIRGFKIGVTRWAHHNGFQDDVWQRNFHDHIIRNERSLERVRRYIRANPVNWTRDRQNSDRRVSR